MIDSYRQRQQFTQDNIAAAYRLLQSILAMVPRSFSPVIASVPRDMVPAKSKIVIKYGSNVPKELARCLFII